MVQKMSIFVTMIVLSLVLHCNTAHPITYKVGDSSGWTFGVAGWEKGKTFKTGNTLVFNYPEGKHTVVIVDKSSYDSCSVPDDAPTFTSGNDNITLAKGSSYYICGVPGHCKAGMKIAIHAA